MNIFISYRRDDTGYPANIVRDYLISEHPNYSVFMDVDSIPLGVDFKVHLQDQIRQCQAMLVLIGENWLGVVGGGTKRRIDDSTDFVRFEVETALLLGIPVVPVLVGKAELPAANQLPPGLQALLSRQAAEIRPGQHLKAHLRTLSRRLILAPQPEKHSVPSISVSRPGPQRRSLTFATLALIPIIAAMAYLSRPITGLASQDSPSDPSPPAFADSSSIIAPELPASNPLSNEIIRLAELARNLEDLKKRPEVRYGDVDTAASAPPPTAPEPCRFEFIHFTRTPEAVKTAPSLRRTSPIAYSDLAKTPVPVVLSTDPIDCRDAGKLAERIRELANEIHGLIQFNENRGLSAYAMVLNEELLRHQKRLRTTLER